MNILGIKIDKTTAPKAKQKVVDFLNSNQQYKIFTPNPEMLVDAQKDEYFKEVLNSGDLNICDGFGLRLISGLQRITGVDFMLDICRIAQDRGVGIYLLGSNSDEVVKKTAENLQKQFPKLKILGYNKGLIINKNNNVTIKQCNNAGITYNSNENVRLLDNIVNSKAKILFVAFGHNKQEKWIFENLNKMTNIKIAMGVGGAFDYISGQTKRAPKWMQTIGTEWLYRLMRQPKRIGRIINATALFSYLIIKKQLLKIN